MRKPVYWFSDQVLHNLGCTAIEDGWRLEISDLDRRGIVLSIVAKTKALISCAVTAQLICVFVFAYAKSLFSHNKAQIMIVIHLLDICALRLIFRFFFDLLLYVHGKKLRSCWNVQLT